MASWDAFDSAAGLYSKWWWRMGTIWKLGLGNGLIGAVAVVLVKFFYPAGGMSG
jgi:hypothetical protein